MLSRLIPVVYRDRWFDLAGAVIGQAVQDLNDPQECENAALWLLSDDFLFYAELLEIEPDRFARRVLARQYRRWRRWTDMVKTFKLVRDCDVTGVSGTGVVAEGVTFQSGQTVICWMRPPYTISVFSSPDAVLGVHGHGGNTKIVWETGARAKKRSDKGCLRDDQKAKDRGRATISKRRSGVSDALKSVRD